MMKNFYILLISLFLISCDYGLEWSEGDYEVHWIDTFENRTLARKIDSSSSIGRVEAEVIAVGSNDKYVVAKRKEISGKEISYYIVNKSNDGKYLNLEEITEGPFTEEKFFQLKKERGLPEFSKEF